VRAPIWWRRAGRLECVLAQRVIRNSRDAALADAEDVVELPRKVHAADLGQPRHLRPEDDGAGRGGDQLHGLGAAQPLFGLV
jgi:hypothetical protein